MHLHNLPAFYDALSQSNALNRLMPVLFRLLRKHRTKGAKSCWPASLPSQPTVSRETALGRLHARQHRIRLLPKLFCNRCLHPLCALLTTRLSPRPAAYPPMCHDVFTCVATATYVPSTAPMSDIELHPRRDLLLLITFPFKV